MKTIKDIRELDQWLDNMRDAMVAQIQRGAEVEVTSLGQSSIDGTRSVAWTILIEGVRDESGALTDELVCLS